MAKEKSLAEIVKERTGENVYLCYQCKRCTAGCPVAAYFDLEPHQVLRAAQLGETERVLNSRTIWLCAHCEACYTRCPQGIDLPRMMDAFKQEAQARGIRAKIRPVPFFYQAALRGIRLFGRMYELGLMVELYGRSFFVGELSLRQILRRDLKMAWHLWRTGKLHLLPHWVHRPKQQPTPPKGALAYYPGCSLYGTALDYHLSFTAVARKLGLTLVEPEGWICCGTTPAHSVDRELATILPMRTLKLVEEMGLHEVVAPCPSCYQRLLTALRDVREDANLRRKVEEELDYRPSDDLRVVHALEALCRHIDLERIRSAVQRPLKGLRLVCYYGCVITRPPALTGVRSDACEYPMMMDRLMEAIGAEVLDWSYKTECCGVSLALTQLPIALDLSAKILRDAIAVGADAIAVACPLCQSNLDSRQEQIREELGLERAIPVLYFTQWMGLAFGLSPKELGLDKVFVSPQPLLERLAS